MTLAESQRALHRHNDTLARLERASRHAFSYAMGVAAGLGGILCLLNAALFVCLCKRARRQVGQGNTEGEGCSENVKLISCVSGKVISGRRDAKSQKCCRPHKW